MKPIFIFKDKLAEAILDMADCFEMMDSVLAKRDQAYSQEISDSDRQTRQEGRDRIMQKALESLQDSSSRKKRSLRFRRTSEYSKFNPILLNEQMY